jgi:3,4-dihydroxy-2-butanone 4-phosphate synthase
MTTYQHVEDAIHHLGCGDVVVLFDAATNESELVVAAQHATTESIAFIVRHTSGFVTVALRDVDCVRLQIPPMWALSDSMNTVTVDAVVGTGTGISAADRATTIRTIADPRSGPADFTRPGHVAPVRARRGTPECGRGAVEVVVDLLSWADVHPIGAMGTLVSKATPTDMAGEVESVEFAEAYGLSFVSVQDIVGQHRLRHASTLELPRRVG